jgi:hypothetical protein
VTISSPRHDRDPDVVENLVPLDRPADVLDVVQALQVGPGHAGIGVLEAAGHHQAVEGDAGLAVDVDQAVPEVDPGHPPLVVDVDARLPVGLLPLEEQGLEVGDLAAVDVGDATGAVGGVLVLGVDGDARVGVDLPRAPRRSDPCGPASDDDDPWWHPAPWGRRFCQ